CAWNIFRDILIFFFSSRRRHTRWPRDWSSDVCSSDLGGDLSGAIMAGAKIGVMTAGSVGTASTTIAPTFVVVNADQVGRDGSIDLIDCLGNWGVTGAGGPPISTGSGGNIRYMRVGGSLFRDHFFGGASDATSGTKTYPAG